MLSYTTRTSLHWTSSLYMPRKRRLRQYHPHQTFKWTLAMFVLIWRTNHCVGLTREFAWLWVQVKHVSNLRRVLILIWIQINVPIYNDVLPCLVYVVYHRSNVFYCIYGFAKKLCLRISIIPSTTLQYHHSNTGTLIEISITYYTNKCSSHRFCDRIYIWRWRAHRSRRERSHRSRRERTQKR